MLRKLPKPKKLATKHRAPSSPKAASRSSNIQAHEYSPETGHLTVTFAGGRKYRYEGVDAKTASGMDDATSRGSYLHSNVIGKFDATKI